MGKIKMAERVHTFFYSVPHQAPRAPSALIKLSRYTMLVAGIMWGRHRYNVNKATEDAFREREKIEKPIRDAAAAKEKERINRETMLDLAKDCGVKVPANF